jgi:hypothetical protein
MSLPTPTPRIHRLPHRTDYTLIPAPLDLSLSQATEKSPLPAIIVTPSSPSSSRDFSIAFLAAPPKLSLLERIASWKHYGGPVPFRIRSILIVLFITFAFICHLAADSLAMRRPYLELNAREGGDASVSQSPVRWIDFSSFFGDTPALLHPDFIINEPSGLR